jgi:2-isopropylmalate synthase
MVRQDEYPFTHSLVLSRLCATSKLLADIVGFGPPPNKAVVGRNAFAHEAGIHQHGVLANPLTYEIMEPSSVGASDHRLVLGKHSGRTALAQRLAELGADLDGIDLDEVYRRFTDLADLRKSVCDEDLMSLLPDQARKSTFPARRETLEGVA